MSKKMRFTLVGLDPFYWRPPRLMGGTRFSAEDCDPLRQTTYVPSTAFAYPIGKSRVGGPRQQWRHFTHRYIWDNLWDERTEYENTNRQNQTKTSIGSRTDLFESSRIAGPLTLECLRPPKKRFPFKHHCIIRRGDLHRYADRIHLFIPVNLPSFVGICFSMFAK